MSSHFASFSTIYRVEVRVPTDVYECFGHTAEYEKVSYSACRAVEASGSMTYSDVIEWGEAPTRAQCEEFANHWHNWILQWQERIRSEAAP